MIQPSGDPGDRFAAVLVGVVDAVLEVFGEFRCALIELVVDDLKHREAHRRVGSRIDTLTLPGHLAAESTGPATPAA